MAESPTPTDHTWAALFRDYGWTFSEEFLRKYVNDPWVYNLANALMDERRRCIETADSSCEVRAADLRHVLDVLIDNGMVEAEDEAVYERLWAACHADR